MPTNNLFTGKEAFSDGQMANDKAERASEDFSSRSETERISSSLALVKTAPDGKDKTKLYFEVSSKITAGSRYRKWPFNI